MESNTKLTPDMVTSPEHWNLSMRIGDSVLDVLLFSPYENNSLIYSSITLNDAAASPLEALQEAVYDNPLLLNDFKSITAIVETPRSMLIPSEVDNIDDREALLLALYPDAIDSRIVINETGGKATFISAVDQSLASFLERTFFNINICHNLSPLCRYFLASAKRSNTRRIYANLRPGAIDVVAVEKGNLLMANTFKSSCPTDTLYYILAVLKSLGIDSADAELMVSGDTATREATVPLLRDYVGSVMPVIFPSAMFKAGKDALKAPFDLIVLHLCE